MYHCKNECVSNHNDIFFFFFSTQKIDGGRKSRQTRQPEKTKETKTKGKKKVEKGMVRKHCGLS